MSDNVVSYDHFRIMQLLKNKDKDVELKDGDRLLLSNWLNKNTNLQSEIYKEILNKRDKKEKLTPTEKVILRGWATKKSQHASSLLTW